MNEKHMKLIRYSVSFLLIAVLCWLFPYTGDDWAWGSQIGLERLSSWFYNYNGRYVGNLIALVLTRSNWLKSLVMSICLTGIAFCAECIFKKKWSFFLSLVLLVLMPKLIFRQAVVWTSGFSNYVTSLSLTLLYIVYIYPIFKSEKENLDARFRLWHSLPMIILAVVNTLIVEHMTIYNVVLAVGVITYTLFAYHKIYISHLAYFLGSISGTAYMFSNVAYHTDGYRHIATGNVVFRALDNYINTITKYLCLDNVWVNLSILLICWLLYCQITAQITGKWTRSIAKLCMVIITFYNAWAVLSSFGISTVQREKPLLYSEGVLVAFYMMALISYTMIAAFYSDRFWEIVFWNGTIMCIASPLLIVYPIGERCFFATYVMFGMLLMELLCMLKNDIVQLILQRKTFSYVCILICFAGLAFYFNIFTSIYRTGQARLSYIRNEVAAGKSSVEILYFPYESYLWCATPTGEPYLERYKLFNDLPKDLELKAVYQYTEE